MNESENRHFTASSKIFFRMHAYSVYKIPISQKLYDDILKIRQKTK